MKVKTYNVYDSTKLKYLLVFYVSQTLYILRFFDLVAVPNRRLYKLLSNSYLAHSSVLSNFRLKRFRARSMFSPSLTGMISIIAPPFLMKRKYRNSINNVTNKMRNFMILKNYEL